MRLKTQAIENQRKPGVPALATGVRHRVPFDFRERRMTMATIITFIKAALNFGKLLPEQLLAFGYGVVKALTGNVNFTNLPVDLNVLKAALDGYSVTIGEARDGSRKAIALRNRQGKEIGRMLRALALYVELNCKDDMNTFLSSGFQPRSTTRTPAKPLDQPVITYIDHGQSGELVVSIKPVKGARHYDLRRGPEGPGGAEPATWVTITVAQTKPATVVDGLTPGMTYAFQVRAYGRPGYTEWSDSATCMCT
jgi:Fibronectin type III domain